jgi:hypothetical protein
MLTILSQRQLWQMGSGDYGSFRLQSDAFPPSICAGVHMAVRMTRSAGMLLLGIWLILSGIAGFAALPIPGVLMAALALIAGVLILIGM